MYKRQIAFGGAVSVALLAAGVLAAGSAYASTNPTATSMGHTSPSAVVSSLPSLGAVRGTVANDVVPAARGIGRAVRGVAGQMTSGSPVSTPMEPASVLEPVSAAIPGASSASGLLGPVTGAAQRIPVLRGTRNTVATPQIGVARLPGLSLGGSSAGQAARSLTPGTVPGTLKGLTGLAGKLPGGAAVSGVTGTVGSAVSGAPLSGAMAPLSGVTGLLGGSGSNGSLPVNGSPLAG